uniref:Uncharacterized protein n=1 Tax=Knipowitschia caucasica TaxID=637954 RepID=A0AAV2KUP5_KNICA
MATQPLLTSEKPSQGQRSLLSPPTVCAVCFGVKTTGGASGNYGRPWALRDLNSFFHLLTRGEQKRQTQTAGFARVRKFPAEGTEGVGRSLVLCCCDWKEHV